MRGKILGLLTQPYWLNKGCIHNVTKNLFHNLIKMIVGLLFNKTIAFLELLYYFIRLQDRVSGKKSLNKMFLII